MQPSLSNHTNLFEIAVRALNFPSVPRQWNSIHQKKYFHDDRFFVHLEHWSKNSLFSPHNLHLEYDDECCLLIHLGLLFTWIESKSSFHACERRRNMGSLLLKLMVLKYLIKFTYRSKFWLRGVDLRLKVNLNRAPIIFTICNRFCLRQM